MNPWVKLLPSSAESEMSGEILAASDFISYTRDLGSCWSFGCLWFTMKQIMLIFYLTSYLSSMSGMPSVFNTWTVLKANYSFTIWRNLIGLPWAELSCPMNELASDKLPGHSISYRCFWLHLTHANPHSILLSYILQQTIRLGVHILKRESERAWGNKLTSGLLQVVLHLSVITYFASMRDYHPLFL